MIAGRIIPAILTTTAAVCGLVILELFKLVQQKHTESYMSRAIGLGMNTYTSFTADSPNGLKTTSEMIVPDAMQLPTEAYDVITGKIKEQFLIKQLHRVYPENHSIWNKLECSGDFTLSQFVDWLSTEHGLLLIKWDFVLGHRIEFDERKNKISVGVSTPIFTPKPLPLDYSLLPSLELTLNQATAQLMKRKTAGVNPQQYIQLWKELKAQGLTVIPSQPSVDSESATSYAGGIFPASTTLREILIHMDAKAQEFLQQGLIETATISHVNKRRFVVIMSSDAPYCVDKKTGDHIEHLCSIKIVLN